MNIPINEPYITVPGNPSWFDRRMIALDMAIQSHGPAAGEAKDQCFTARAEHFLRFLNDWDPE